MLPLELITLKDRRLRGDLIQMFKIMNKIMDKCDRYNRLKIILNQVKSLTPTNIRSEPISDKLHAKFKII